MNKYVSLFLWIALYLGVGFAIGSSTEGSIQGWYKTLEKPEFNPPNWIFPIMWSILYAMIATAGWNLWRKNAASSGLKTIFIIYTICNFAWTPIFFGMEQIYAAFICIMAVNFFNALFIYKAWSNSRSFQFSMYMMIPPLLWTLFAAVLNYAIWVLN